MGLFKKNKIIASGHIVHVYVDRKNYTPKKIGKKFRSILKTIFVDLKASFISLNYFLKPVINITLVWFMSFKKPGKIVFFKVYKL